MPPFRFSSGASVTNTVGNNDSGESLGGLPPVESWNVHVLSPWAMLSDLPPSGAEGTHKDEIDSEPACTEWGPSTQAAMTAHLTQVGVASVTWWRTTIHNCRRVLQSIPHDDPTVIVVNLCDGSEDDGWPGLTVLREVEKHSFAVTGARSDFYLLDTCKTEMKHCLTQNGASTPGYLDITSFLEQGGDEAHDNALKCLAELRLPVIVKPSPSSGSNGIFEKSVCSTYEDAWLFGLELKSMLGGSVYVEEFIAGREFTALVTGDAYTGTLQSYAVVERVFSKTLAPTKQFLSLHMKWNEWGATESAGMKWWYAPAPAVDQSFLQATAVQVYQAANGCGYARMDMRMDTRTGRVYVIDVNANCSLDCEGNPEDSAMGLILHSSGLAFKDLLKRLLRYALVRKLMDTEPPRIVASSPTPEETTPTTGTSPAKDIASPRELLPSSSGTMPSKDDASGSGSLVYLAA